MATMLQVIVINACQGASELISYCMVSRLHLGAWQCNCLLTYLLT